jgi:hypothetical protein
MSGHRTMPSRHDPGDECRELLRRQPLSQASRLFPTAAHAICAAESVSARMVQTRWRRQRPETPARQGAGPRPRISPRKKAPDKPKGEEPMILHLEWTRAIPLRDGTKQNMIYTIALDKLQRVPGVYILGRRYSSNFEALYVGKANRIRSRVRGQLNNLRLMQHLKNAKSGKRILLAGQFRPRPGQSLEKCLALIERALIRYFLSEGHDLVNKQGVRLRRHEIASAGSHPKKLFPGTIYLEK